MLVVDAGCLFELFTEGTRADSVFARLAVEPELAAPHIIDVETFGVIRQRYQQSRLDTTAAVYAIGALKDWPGERFPHRPLLARAWELRDSVRGWDAMYVALAESLEATLITTDHRLARAHGPRCAIEVPGA